MGRKFRILCTTYVVALGGVLVPALGIAKKAPAQTCNPIGNIPGLPCLATQNTSTNLAVYLATIRDSLLAFAGALAVLFIVWGGIQYIYSAGNEETAKKAKMTLTYAIIGLIFILLAKVIFSLITGDLLGSVFTGSAPY